MSISFRDFYRTNVCERSECLLLVSGMFDNTVLRQVKMSVVSSERCRNRTRWYNDTDGDMCAAASTLHRNASCHVRITSHL